MYKRLLCYVDAEPIYGDQKALAFTPQQYAVAERIMGRVRLIHDEIATSLSCTLCCTGTDSGVAQW